MNDPFSLQLPAKAQTNAAPVDTNAQSAGTTETFDQTFSETLNIVSKQTTPATEPGLKTQEPDDLEETQLLVDGDDIVEPDNDEVGQFLLQPDETDIAPKLTVTAHSIDHSEFVEQIAARPNQTAESSAPPAQLPRYLEETSQAEMAILGTAVRHFDRPTTGPEVTDTLVAVSQTIVQNHIKSASPKTAEGSDLRKVSVASGTVFAGQNRTEPALPIQEEAQNSTSVSTKRELVHLPIDAAYSPPRSGAANLPSVTPLTFQSHASSSPRPLTAITADPLTIDEGQFLTFDADSPTIQEQRLTTLVQTAPAFTRPETPTLVGRQMADALKHMPNGQVELALNPEELGRVKMSIASSDAGIVVSILAERPETLTLMRRNIDQLAAEFHALGYAQIEFNFAGGQSDKNRENNSDGRPDHRLPNGVAVSETAAPVHSISLVASDGLDLRL